MYVGILFQAFRRKPKKLRSLLNSYLAAVKLKKLKALREVKENQCSTASTCKIKSRGTKQTSFMTYIKMSLRHEVQTVKICCNHKVFLPVMKQCTNYVKKKKLKNTEETTVHVYDQKMIFGGNWAKF